MHSSLQLISTAKMTREEWLLYRKTGIGASEVGCIMGLSQYKSSIELFYEKIGEEIGYNVENINMFMGKFQESSVAELWEYWDGSEESMMVNYYNNNKMRRCQRVNAYVRNPLYPWLFVSLDRKINKHDNRDEGALEVKTINGYEADKWEAGIPPSHVVQVQTQCKVCMFEYGELATLKDGRRFDVVPFEINKIITDNIIESTFEFWERVERGREVVTQRFQAQRTFNMKAVEELSAEIAALEPPPDNTEAYADFIKARYGRSTEGERPGTILELEVARKEKAAKENIKELQEDARLYSNQLKNFVGSMERIDFGASGFVSWKSDVNGTRRLLNKTK